jgi:hypothetical protein
MEIIIFTFFAVANVTPAPPVVTTLRYRGEKCEEVASQLSQDGNVGSATGNAFKIVAKCIQTGGRNRDRDRERDRDR